TGNKQVTIQFKETGTAVSGETEKYPDRFALEQNYPNPFNPETTIRFAVPETGPVRLTVCSASGQIVRNLVDATMPAGTHEVVWDGRDDQCRSASSGLYIVAMKSGLSEKRIKCILMR
ncbi:MAG TPA: FlgD immunoglobulin-like domain containing protein, partial [bacterium]